MSSVSDLYLLQELDTALDRAVARLLEIEELLEETEELTLSLQAKEEKEQRVVALRDRQKEVEWEVEELRAKAAGVEGKLYGGSVSSPKELSDLDADLRAIRAFLGRREDALLALLVEVDEAEAERNAATDTYSRIETAWSSACKDLVNERGVVRPDTDTLRERREGRIAGLDQSSLGLYTLLRERKAGLAVARVEQGMCQGCRISLPAAVVQKARVGTSPVQCVSCERILFVA